MGKRAHGNNGTNRLRPHPFLDKKLPKSLEQQGLEGSTAVGKDEVGSSNLPTSSKKSLETAMVSRFFSLFAFLLKYGVGVYLVFTPIRLGVQFNC